MKFNLPPLPYSPDALEPVISRDTIHYHYGKHEQNYIDTLNKLIEGTPYADMSLEEIVRESDGKIFNNASQAWNHIFYFFSLNPAPERHEPCGELRKRIEAQFGSFQDFKEKMIEAGTSLFGSGWVWLAADKERNLYIIQGTNALNPMVDNLQPIMTIDVWEHAYYLDYQNRRAEYLKHIWDIIDWEVVELRF